MSDGPTEPAHAPRRPRNATATRAAILDAARVALTQRGYEGVGLREVAAAVGVNAALVIRYFGSKEKLFAEAVAGQLGIGELLAGERANFGEGMARYLIFKAHDPAFDALLILLRSAASEHAAPLLCAELDTQFIRPLAVWLGGDEATVRAGLIAAYITGLSVLRDVLHSTALADADAERLVTLVAPVLQGYVDG